MRLVSHDAEISKNGMNAKYANSSGLFATATADAVRICRSRERRELLSRCPARPHLDAVSEDRDRQPVEEFHKVILELRQEGFCRVRHHLNRAALTGIVAAQVHHGNRVDLGLDLQEPEIDAID